MIIEAFDGNLFATIDNSIFALKEIPKFKVESTDFEDVTVVEEKYVYIPKMIHPWKAQSFINFITACYKKQELEKQLVLAQN